MAIGKFEQASVLFAGQGDLFIFDEVSDYGKATLASLTSPKSLGQIVQDSTSWEGEDPEVSEILDEQGNVITAKTAAGTLGFSFNIASTSSAMLKKFLRAVSVELPTGSSAWTGEGSATGFGVEVPTIVTPIAIVNDTKDRTWLFPKAKITSSVTMEDGLYVIHCSVIAEYVNTDSLKTAMVIDAKVA
jgi:hypothetical protein